MSSLRENDSPALAVYPSLSSPVNTNKDRRPKLWRFVLREASAVFAWSVLSCGVRMALSLLTALSSIRSSSEKDADSLFADVASTASSSIACAMSSVVDGSCANNGENGAAAKIWEGTVTVVSILTGWFLSFMPTKAVKVSYARYGSAPGFSFASTWILYPIRDRFGSMPNVPSRICETYMGRLTLRELAVVLPVHFVVPTFGMHVLWLLLPASVSRHAIDPITYSEQNPWIVDFVREVLVNALFTVGLMALPELLRINGVRRGFTLLFMYPLYSFGVDAVGTASVFGPETIYALRSANKYEEVPLTQWSHMLGPMVGGILGGYTMVNFFPDDTHGAPTNARRCH